MNHRDNGTMSDAREREKAEEPRPDYGGGVIAVVLGCAAMAILLVCAGLCIWQTFAGGAR